MMKKIMTRIRNPKVITGIVSGALLILVNCGVIDTHMSNTILNGVNTVLSILVGMGIFANPDTPLIKNSDPEQIAPAPQPEVKPEPVVVPVAPSNQPIAPVTQPEQPVQSEVAPVQENK